MASDFAHATANAAETLTRSWNEAKEAIARDLANTRADLEARFEEIARITMAAVGPGTVMGDYLTLAGEQAIEPERAAALERFATFLGLVPRQLIRPAMRQGLRPRAKLALTRIVEREDLERSQIQQILREEIPFAVLAAIAAFDEDRTRRHGRTWLTDQHGKLLRFTPSDRYTLRDLLGPARDHLRDLARGILEAELIERACLTDADDKLISANWDEIEERGYWRDDSTAAKEGDDAVTAKRQEGRATPLTGTSSAEDVLLGAALLERVALLTPPERAVFSLLELEDPEIASKLAISKHSVRRRRSSIIKKLSMA